MFNLAVRTNSSEARGTRIHLKLYQSTYELVDFAAALRRGVYE
jgi:uncharacterized protein (DUF1778 family)